MRILLSFLYFLGAFSTQLSAASYGCSTSKSEIFPSYISLTLGNGNAKQQGLLADNSDYRVSGSRAGSDYTSVFLAGENFKGSIRYSYGINVNNNPVDFNFAAQFFGEKSSGATNIFGNSSSDNTTRWTKSARYSCTIKNVRSSSPENKKYSQSVKNNNSPVSLKTSCKLSEERIKEVQGYLRELGLYSFKVDGILGAGTRRAIDKAKVLIGKDASVGDCLTENDLKLIGELALKKVCSVDALDQCSDQTLCARATTVRNGIRSWNLDAKVYVNAAADKSLNCNVTVETLPFSREEALYFLTELVDYVSANVGEFDLKFAAEFDKVRPITSGEWSTGLSKDFELFRQYISKFPGFEEYLDAQRLAKEAVEQRRIEQLREVISQDVYILKEWAKVNVLDSKAAEIAELYAAFGDKTKQEVNKLEQLASEAKRLVSATGIGDTPLNGKMHEALESLYNPSSIYVFANNSGDAASLYKDLEGKYQFEQGLGTICISDKLGAFEHYLISTLILDSFSGLNSTNELCSQSADIFVLKGNELTSESVLGIIPLGTLSRVNELTKLDRDKAYDKLEFLMGSIKKDVLDGTRIGFGFLKVDQNVSKICAIFYGNEYGHNIELERHVILMKALELEWRGFSHIVASSEEAFKLLQRNQCGAIYADSLNLGRLYLAASLTDLKLDFLPIWISTAAVEETQRAYDISVEAAIQENVAAKQNLQDKEKLDEQARQFAAETAAVRQRELREQNGLRFMVLKDEFQISIFEAVDFGLQNSPEHPDYMKKYLAQPFVDKLTRSSPFDEIISAMQDMAAQRWEITEKRLDQVDYGNATFGQRNVDGLQIELKIAAKNRIIGKYSEYCRTINAIKDEDFDMWRNILVSECEEKNRVLDWNIENDFRSLWIVTSE